jgi:hypothetical protein
MGTSELSPPGWYVDPLDPERWRYWDGYGFPDQGVTLCPLDHEVPTSAVFCPTCGLAAGICELVTFEPLEA